MPASSKTTENDALSNKISANNPSPLPMEQVDVSSMDNETLHQPLFGLPQPQHQHLTNGSGFTEEACDCLDDDSFHQMDDRSTSSADSPYIPPDSPSPSINSEKPTTSATPQQRYRNAKSTSQNLTNKRKASRPSMLDSDGNPKNSKKSFSDLPPTRQKGRLSRLRTLKELWGCSIQDVIPEDILPREGPGNGAEVLNNPGDWSDHLLNELVNLARLTIDDPKRACDLLQVQVRQGYKTWLVRQHVRSAVRILKEDQGSNRAASEKSVRSSNCSHGNIQSPNHILSHSPNQSCTDAPQQKYPEGDVVQSVEYKDSNDSPDHAVSFHRDSARPKQSSTQQSPENGKAPSNHLDTNRERLEDGSQVSNDENEDPEIISRSSVSPSLSTTVSPHGIAHPLTRRNVQSSTSLVPKFPVSVQHHYHQGGPQHTYMGMLRLQMQIPEDRARAYRQAEYAYELRSRALEFQAQIAEARARAAEARSKALIEEANRKTIQAYLNRQKLIGTPFAALPDFQ